MAHTHIHSHTLIHTEAVSRPGWTRWKRSGALYAASSFLLVGLMLLLSAAALAQSSDINELDRYSAAVKQAGTSDRIAALEHFVSSASSSLKIDAMELLVWDYKQQGNHPQATKWAQELAQADPDNGLALAVLSDNARHAALTQTPQQLAESLSLTARGLSGIDRLRKPAGMSDSDFASLQRQVKGILNGELGYADLQRKDYATARISLRKAVALLPDNAQYVYALSLADLMGPAPNQTEGYWHLARAVNLTQGTPAGLQIAAYAADKYRQDGGTARDWEKFLVATASPGASAGSPTTASTNPTVVSAAASQNAATTSSAGSSSATMPSKTTATTAPTPAVANNNSGTSSPLPKETNAASARSARLTAPPLPPLPATSPTPLPPKKPRVVAPPGAPVSLGILVEASVAERRNRKALIDSLIDLVRHLRSSDEAFILSFSNDLVFQQDLTANNDLLEQAMEDIKPASGTSLLDAVGFAAGHLSRIAKNSNRVLIVISDGRNATSHASPLELSGEISISGVRIYCIGMGVADPDGKSRLEALASSTGGRASFISDATQFRAAAHEIAAGLGIDFPM
jgi:tetratricopeptide (TPR) repeat protein